MSAMDQPSTSGYLSSSLGKLSERSPKVLKSTPANIKLIPLSKLKNLMPKSPQGTTLANLNEQIIRGATRRLSEDQLQLETPGNQSEAQNRLRIDRLVLERTNAGQEYANKSNAQSGGISHIEGTSTTSAQKSTVGGVQNNNSSCDHHQSVDEDEDEEVALNQFEIGVTQQEFKPEQQRHQRQRQRRRPQQQHCVRAQLGTISCGEGSCTFAIDKREGGSKKVESIESGGGKFQADKQPRARRQQASLDQLELVASRGERKKIYGNLPSRGSDACGGANTTSSGDHSNSSGKTVSVEPGGFDIETVESAVTKSSKRKTLCSSIGGTDWRCSGGGTGLTHNMTPSSSTIVKDSDDHTEKPQHQRQLTSQINSNAHSYHTTTTQVDGNLHSQNSSEESNFVSASYHQRRQQLIPLIARPSELSFVVGDNYSSSSYANQMILKQQHHQSQEHQNQQRVSYLNRDAKYSDYITDRSNARTGGRGSLTDEVTSAASGLAVDQQRMAAATTDYNHNNQTHFQLKNSPRSSSSTTSTPSPGSSRTSMQALAATSHTTANPLISAAAELNHSAVMAVASDSHLDHLNHQYIASAAAAGLSHHHYSVYAHQAPDVSGVSNQQQSHHIATNQDQVSAYNQLQHQQQQQQNQSQHLQQHPQHHQQQVQEAQQQQQHQQQQQQSQQAISSQQSIYHQIASGALGNNHSNGGSGYGNTGVANTNSQYHSQLQSNGGGGSEAAAHQSQLNSAAAACAAAAVVSQTLKTVANQHNQHHSHHPYGSGTGISNGFAAGASAAAGLMNMTAQHHPHFHGLGGHHQQHQQQQHHNTLNHQSHHLGQQHVSLGTIQSNTQHQLQQTHHHVQSSHHTATHHQHQLHHQQQQQQQQQQHQQHQQQQAAAAVVHSLMPVHHHHQASHGIVARKYQCKMCPQVFMSKAEMKYHNQQHLREAKPYKCLQCPKAFANSSYLSQHMRIHQGLKPYTCDICSRKFTQLSHLQQHKRTHTGDKPYKCTYMNCTKQFSQLSNLQSHSRCHQLDKPYKCNSCYKCFHDEQSLLEHIPRHLESKHLKRNLCIFCGSSYQQERGLVKHFQQYHTDKSPTLVAAAIAAGTTGNTSLIASLVSSTQSKFTAPSSGGGSTTSSISSVGGGANNSIGIQGGGVIAGISNQATPVARGNNSSNNYQIGAGFH